MLEMVVNKLPEIAQAVSEPLSKTEKIILFGEGGATSMARDTAGTMLQSFEAIKQAVGLDIPKMLKDVSTAFSVGEAIVRNDYSGLDPRNTPVKRDFVRPLDGNTQRYYNAMGGYKGDRKELLAMIPNWTPEERNAFVKAHPWAALPEVDKIIQKVGELQKLEDGYMKGGRRGKWVKRKDPPTDEQKEKWKAARLRYQAKFLEIAEKHGGEH